MRSQAEPWERVPPAVPAIAVLTLLGIATLDSFRFEGKGGTLVLGLLANLSPEHRDRVVRVVVNMVDYDLNPQAALDAPRWRFMDSNKVLLEPAVPADVVRSLLRMGHQLQQDDTGFLVAVKLSASILEC